MFCFRSSGKPLKGLSRRATEAHTGWGNQSRLKKKGQKQEVQGVVVTRVGKGAGLDQGGVVETKRSRLLQRGKEWIWWWAAWWA